MSPWWYYLSEWAESLCYLPERENNREICCVIACQFVGFLYLCLCIKSAHKEPPTEQPKATVAKRCGLFNQKKYGSMQQDLFSQWEQHALLSRDEIAYDTVRFFRNAKVIFDLFDEWKNKDRFYFIPLKLSLTYCMGGHTFRMSEDEIHLGTFIRTILERDDLFTGTCPECGRKLYPYGVLGPTLIFRVRLEASCDCGWRGKVFSGDWAIWNVALRKALKKDRRRLITARLFNPFFKVTTIESLMEYLWQ